jgi:putative proteasome-type protease
MTFCLGIKVTKGLIALADTQIAKGDERLSKAKLSLIPYCDQPLFIMTSGLRSVRDKTVIYLEEQLRTESDQIGRLYQVANLFGTQLRRVRAEDGEALARSGLHFNLHAIIGGQFHADSAPTLFYVYPEGNWIEAAFDSPYFVIGRTAYGKPILDRLLNGDTEPRRALGLAYLAFDATRASVTDVDFPFDVFLLDAATGHLKQQRFTSEMLAGTGDWWQQRLADALEELPLAWAEPLLSHITAVLEPEDHNQ